MRSARALSEPELTGETSSTESANSMSCSSFIAKFSYNCASSRHFNWVGFTLYITCPKCEANFR